MRRGLLVMAGLLVLTGMSMADYVIIRINLNGSDADFSKLDEKDGQPGSGPAGPGAGRGGAGAPGMPGGPGGPGGGQRGNAGGPGGGQRGYPGGPGGPPGGPGGPGGAGGGQRGYPGRPGGPGAGGPGAGGPGAGGPGAGGPGAGGPGAGGGGRAGGAGAGAGLPGAPGPGFADPNGRGGAAASNQEDTGAKANWFITVLEANITNSNQGQYVNHRWGRTAIPATISIPNLAEMTHQRVESLSVRIDKKRKDLMKDDPLKFAEWLLQHWNMPTDEKEVDVQKVFETLIDDLVRIRDRNAGDKGKIDALVAVRDLLKKPLPPADEEMVQLRSIPGVGDEYRVLSKDHYMILHPPREEATTEKKRKRLERVMAAYYYWFALQGVQLPMPEKQLLCVVTKDVDGFRSLHAAMDKAPMLNDGFYSAFDNVAIFAPTRVDLPFEQLALKATTLEKDLTENGLDLEKLVKGQALSKQAQEFLNQKPSEFQYGQIMALALRAASEEGEIATLTYEAIQQLASVSGVLPRRVRVPQAVRFGLGSLFETPKSVGGDFGFRTLWSGVGGPHWAYYPMFRKIVDAEKTNNQITLEDRKLKIEKPSIIKIITDQGLNAADHAAKDDADAQRMKARAEVWALNFFMAHKKMPNLVRFYGELARMPRDMELTPEVVEIAFVRAFDLGDAENPDKLSVDKLAKLEKDWYSDLSYLNFEVDPNPKSKDKDKDKDKK